jgi:hypothetical protein
MAFYRATLLAGPGLPDAHGLGIPTGATRGSVADYAIANLREVGWPGVMTKMFDKELKRCV